MADDYESIADKVKAWDCGPDLSGTKSTREIAALHTLRDSFAANLETFYRTWGAEAGDDYIRPILHAL